MQTTTQPARTTPKQVKAHLRATRAGSVGETERLANIHTTAERHALWFAYQHLFDAETQILFDAVMGDCHRRIAQAVNAGMLSLWPRGAAA